MPLFTLVSGNAQLSPGEGPQVPLTEQETERQLTESSAVGYLPNLPVRSTLLANQTTPPYYIVLYDVEAMLAHPTVNICLQYYCAGIWPARFKIRASSSAVEEFVQSQLRRWWQRALRQIQWCGYGWGWSGGEITYCINRGRLEFDDILTFAPPDAVILTSHNQYIGIRVRSGRPMGEDKDKKLVDLWGPAPHRPSKAFWYVHKRRYGQWYGWTQLYGAWRPWRRKAWPNGAEEITDGGVYRFAYQGPLGRYPPGSEKGTRRPSGLARQDNRDKMLELTEGVKAGAGVALSSARDERGNLLWDIEFPKSTLDVVGLLAYDERLADDISLGIEVPPELLRAAKSGGYTGRNVVVEAHYVNQQHNAECHVQAARTHSIDALVWWNYGPDAWYDVEVESLVESHQIQSKGMSAMPGAPVPGESPASAGIAQQREATAAAIPAPKPAEPAQPSQPGQPAQQTLSLQKERDELVDQAEEVITACAKFSRKALKQCLDVDSHEWMARGLDLTRELIPRMADAIGDIRLSAMMAGAVQVLEASELPDSVSLTPTWEFNARQFKPACAVAYEKTLHRKRKPDSTEWHNWDCEQRDLALAEADRAFSTIMDRLELAAQKLSSVGDRNRLIEILTAGTLLEDGRARQSAEKMVTSSLADGLDAAIAWFPDKYPYAHCPGSPGINNSGVYRRDDPAFRQQRRLLRWKPMTVDQAAGMVPEASEWKRTGMSPSIPTYSLALEEPVPVTGSSAVPFADIRNATGELSRVRRAPPGGIWINGKFYPGGKFIPGAEVARASPAEKRALAKSAGISKRELEEDVGDYLSPDQPELPPETEREHLLGTWSLRILLDDCEFESATLRRVHEVIQDVQDADLSDRGRVAQPYLPLLEGIPAQMTPETIQQAVLGFGPVRFELAYIWALGEDEDDLLYVEVQGLSLMRLFEKLLGIQHTPWPADFVPYFALAYVKRGRSLFYLGEGQLAGMKGLCRRLTLVAPTGQVMPVDLGESVDPG